MDAQKTQFSRWIFIHQQIASKTYPNCSSLAQEYEVSTKTILRDIDFLKQEFNAPIQYNAAKRGYFYTEPFYSFPLVQLKESEWLAFFILEKLLEPYQNTPFYEKTKAGLNKIKSFLEKPIMVKESWLSKNYSFLQSQQAVINPAVFDAVTQALDQKKVLLIKYKKPHHPQEFREVEPWHLFFSDGQAYLMAFCKKRKSKRTFALSRVLFSQVLDQTYTLPLDFNPNLARQTLKAVPLPQEIEVVVLFHSYEAPFVKERVWFENQVIEEREKGELILKFKTFSLFEAKKWLLSFGWTAQVLSPQSLAQDIVLEAQKIINNYQSPQY